MNQNLEPYFVTTDKNSLSRLRATWTLDLSERNAADCTERHDVVLSIWRRQVGHGDVLMATVSWGMIDRTAEGEAWAVAHPDERRHPEAGLVA